MKIAFFVEGQTERIFVEKFLGEYFGIHNIEILIQKNLGYRGIELIGERKSLNARYYVLIFDASGDGSITSAVKERAEKMINESGYSFIIALHDLYRNERSQKKSVIEAFYKLFDSYLFKHQIKLILAIMEIEAWFLADYNLFSRINPEMTNAAIKEKLGYDLANDNSELYEHPSSIINEIFRLYGKSYKKRKDDSYKIAYNIDYNYMCCSEDILNKITSWKFFLNSINTCFSNS